MACPGFRIDVPFDALDLATVDEFERTCREALLDPASRSRRRVVLDLRAVEVLTAAGVRALYVFEAELESRGQALGLTHTAPIVERVLDVCGLADRIVR